MGTSLTFQWENPLSLLEASCFGGKPNHCWEHPLLVGETTVIAGRVSFHSAF